MLALGRVQTWRTGLLCFFVPAEKAAHASYLGSFSRGSEVDGVR